MSAASCRVILRSWLLASIAGLCLIHAATAQEAAPDTEKAREIEALVTNAVSLVGATGRAAFEEFHKNGSQWRNGDTYLFGNALNGMQILNTGFPALEGTDQCCTKDATGKMVFQEFKRVLEANGEGWVSYMWPKPGQTAPSQKWSYIKAVEIDGERALIGAGFYPE